MSLRDTLVQLGYVLIALGGVFAARALLMGPLARFTTRLTEVPDPQRDATPDPEDDRKS